MGILCYGEYSMKLKPIQWLPSTKEDLLALPEGVQDEIGFHLFQAQLGKKSDRAKPLKGFHGASVLEVVEYDEGGTYRAIYTVQFKEMVFVLHVFKKKSKQGISTPKKEIDLIKDRLKLAEQMYMEWCKEIHEKQK